MIPLFHVSSFIFQLTIHLTQSLAYFLPVLPPGMTESVQTISFQIMKNLVPIFIFSRSSRFRL